MSDYTPSATPPKPAPDASRLGQELTASFKEAIVRAMRAPSPAGAENEGLREKLATIKIGDNAVLRDVVRRGLVTLGWCHPSMGAEEMVDAILEVVVAAPPVRRDRETIIRLAEIHLGAWLKESDPALQLIPTAARQDIRDFADAILSLPVQPTTRPDEES